MLHPRLHIEGGAQQIQIAWPLWLRIGHELILCLALLDESVLEDDAEKLLSFIRCDGADRKERRDRLKLCSDNSSL